MWHYMTYNILMLLLHRLTNSHHLVSMKRSNGNDLIVVYTCHVEL